MPRHCVYCILYVLYLLYIDTIGPARPVRSVAARKIYTGPNSDTIPIPVGFNQRDLSTLTYLGPLQKASSTSSVLNSMTQRSTDWYHDLLGGAHAKSSRQLVTERREFANTARWMKLTRWRVVALCFEMWSFIASARGGTCWWVWETMV